MTRASASGEVSTIRAGDMPVHGGRKRVLASFIGPPRGNICNWRASEYSALAFAMNASGESPRGGVAEWLKAHAWKVCIRETVSRVRIPPPPPFSFRTKPSQLNEVRASARNPSSKTGR